MASFMSQIPHTISTLWMLTTWADMAEIGIISSCIYYASLWLKKDRDKNLLGYFYAYFFLIFATHSLQLTTLSSLCLLFSPAIIMLFMLMHQELLQHNFVALKNVTVSTHTNNADWLSTIMKATLTMLAHNKNILILIEHTDALAPHTTINDPLDVPITSGIITLLFDALYSSEYFCWISSNGIVRGINTTFKASWHPGAYQTNSAWVDDAVAYTSKTDCLILHADAQTHQYSIAHNGIITECLSMEQAHQLIKKCINYKVPIAKKGYSHGIPKQESFSQHST